MKFTAFAVSNYLFIGTICLVPFCYGATPFHIVEILVGVVITVSAFNLFIHRQRLHFPMTACAPLFLLAALGYFMTWNAEGIFDPGAWEMLPRSQPLSSFPGSIDLESTRQTFLRYTSLFVAFLVALNIGTSPRYTSRLMLSLAVAGILLALLGIAQRLSGASDIYWGNRHLYAYFFSTFRYQGNAGAFFNLIFPLVIWLLYAYRSSKGPLGSTPLRLSILTISALAVFMHGSRAASAITLLGLLAAYLIFRTRIHAEILRSRSRLLAVSLLVIGGAITVAATAGSRWIGFFTDPELNSTWERLESYRIAWSIIPDIGLTGFGPGTFKWIFPFYGGGIEPGVEGFWRFLHQDYLQTLIEWGWMGSAVWVFFIVATMRQFCRHFRQHPHLIPCSFGLLMVAVHALGDFPFQIYSIQLLTFIFLGLIWGSGYQSNRCPNSSSSTSGC